MRRVCHHYGCLIKYRRVLSCRCLARTPYVRRPLEEGASSDLLQARQEEEGAAIIASAGEEEVAKVEAGEGIIIIITMGAAAVVVVVVVVVPGLLTLSRGWEDSSQIPGRPQQQSLYLLLAT